MLTRPGYLILDNISQWVQSSTFVRKIGSTTYAFVVGGHDNSLESTFQGLKHGVQLLGCPLLLSVVDLEMKADYSRRVLDKCHRHMNEFEPSTGYHIDDNKNIEGKLIEPKDFEKQIRRLTAVTGRVAWCKWTGDVHTDLLLFLENELSFLSVYWACPKVDISIMVHRVHYLQNFVKQNKWRAIYMEERRNGYIQTVCPPTPAPREFRETWD